MTHSDVIKRKAVALGKSLGSTVASETFGVSRVTIGRWAKEFADRGEVIEPSKNAFHTGVDATGKTRRIYSQEFREEAVKKVGDRKPEVVAAELGIPSRTLRRWISETRLVP